MGIQSWQCDAASAKFVSALPEGSEDTNNLITVIHFIHEQPSAFLSAVNIIPSTHFPFCIMETVLIILHSLQSIVHIQGVLENIAWMYHTRRLACAVAVLLPWACVSSFDRHCVWKLTLSNFTPKCRFTKKKVLYRSGQRSGQKLFYSNTFIRILDHLLHCFWYPFSIQSYHFSHDRVIIKRKD